jgi:AcrR family transcriptional regulator
MIIKRALTYVKLAPAKCSPLGFSAIVRSTMTRPKTITDEEILAVARAVFRTQGHSATTREIGQKAGISEGVLYQRFGSKDDLFFASMAPTAPDVDQVLGPEPPTEEASTFVKSVLGRMAVYFGEVIPLALHVMTHPSFSMEMMRGAQVVHTRLHEGLARRLLWFETQKRIRRATAKTTAHLLVSLAHDSAIPGSSRSAAVRSSELEDMAAIVWRGIDPGAPKIPPKRPARRARGTA